MPPKQDPYATRSARAADLILILLALLAILFAVWTAPHRLSSTEFPPRTFATVETQ